jgi:hypothetical protein
MKLGEKTEDDGKNKTVGRGHAPADPLPMTAHANQKDWPPNFHVIARSRQATWQSPGRWLCSQNHQEIATALTGFAMTCGFQAGPSAVIGVDASFIFFTNNH